MQFGKGAKAILIEDGADISSFKIPKDITVIISNDTRYALSICACNFYGNPTRKLKLIGITGTKGKTTTSFMIKEILQRDGKKVGLIGTIGIYINDKKLENSKRTTPESTELQKLFVEMLKQKVEYVVMEVSSQALKLDRVTGCDFDIGVFTNLSEDHIGKNEHDNFGDYIESKAKLFKMCKMSFINSDDMYSKTMGEASVSPVTTYGIDNNPNVFARDIIITSDYVDFRTKVGKESERVRVYIPGRFSVYNALAAIVVCSKLGVNDSSILEGLASVVVPGRNQIVPNDLGFTTIVDYAHSPKSLESILGSIKAYAKGKIICVFGCGGDRDKFKRPIMGEIAGKNSTFVIITSDNPRTEEPMQIIKEIEEGIVKTKCAYKIEPDRKAAICEALKIARKNDVILIAGKGHETYQEINKEFFDFDDVEVTKKLLKQT